MQIKSVQREQLVSDNHSTEGRRSAGETNKELYMEGEDNDWERERVRRRRQGEQDSETGRERQNPTIQSQPSFYDQQANGKPQLSRPMVFWHSPRPLIIEMCSID